MIHSAVDCFLGQLLKNSRFFNGFLLGPYLNFQFLFALLFKYNLNNLFFHLFFLN